MVQCSIHFVVGVYFCPAFIALCHHNMLRVSLVVLVKLHDWHCASYWPLDMELNVFVPICPPAPTPPIADFLIRSGWPDCAGPVKAAAIWLQRQGVHCERDFTGLDEIQFLPDADSLPGEAIEFIQSLVVAAPLPVLLTPDEADAKHAAKRCLLLSDGTLLRCVLHYSAGKRLSNRQSERFRSRLCLLRSRRVNHLMHLKH